jgi:3-deoxy-D-manno-octulosonic-acid transferase
VSVGEVQAARPLFHALRQEFPGHLIAVSTVTITGQKLARQVFKEDAVRVFYFPVDWRWTVRRALNAVNPALVLIMETELWPNFLRECRDRAVPVAIVNGRLSETSFSRYRLFPHFMRKVVNFLHLALMQTDADAQRMRALGLDSSKVIVCGNVKFDAGSLGQSQTLTDELAQRFGFSNQIPVLVAASTHEPEETILIQSFHRLRAAGMNSRFVIAPRHPERFDTVASLLNQAPFSWVRRSASAEDSDREADVVLFDTIGELRALFPVATVVFMGGSIAPVGGHNILEPAAAGACIVIGPNTQNFDEMVKRFTARQALVQIPPQQNGAMASSLAETFKKLLNDPYEREILAARGQQLIEENRGATSCAIDHIKALLSM